MASATKAGAKAAGMAKGAAKKLAGYSEIFQHLSAEHTEVSMMMKRVASSSENSKVRDELFPEIRKKLLSHAHAEEAEFYKPLGRFSEIEDLVMQCIDEHKKIEQYLDQLASGSKNTKTWSDLFSRMMRAVDKHVEREENDLFPQANELLSDDQADRIGTRYERVEEQEKAHL